MQRVRLIALDDLLEMPDGVGQRTKESGRLVSEVNRKIAIALKTGTRKTTRTVATPPMANSASLTVLKRFRETTTGSASWALSCATSSGDSRNHCAIVCSCST